MATSTERTVRNTLIVAIQSISQTRLGFDLPLGNVQAWPLEMQLAEKHGKYLPAQVDGRNQARAWAVDVQGHDTPFTMNNVQIREYSIRILAYYDVNGNAENYLTLVDHARHVRKAIIDLGISLSGTVTRITSTQPFSFGVVASEGFGNLYTAAMLMTAERTNPDY